MSTEALFSILFVVFIVGLGLLCAYLPKAEKRQMARERRLNRRRWEIWFEGDRDAR